MALAFAARKGRGTTGGVVACRGKTARETDVASSSQGGRETDVAARKGKRMASQLVGGEAESREGGVPAQRVDLGCDLR